MNFHAALVEVADGKVTSNASGHHVAKILKKYYMIPGEKVINPMQACLQEVF